MPRKTSRRRSLPSQRSATSQTKSAAAVSVSAADRSNDAFASAFALSVIRLLIATASLVARDKTAAIPRRLVVNVLRGTQSPPEGCVVPWAGILSGTSAAWLHGLLERLADEGLIERHGKGKILLTPRGVEIAATNDADGIAAEGRANGAARTIYHDLLPQQAALGRNPREEQALADARRKLAAEEGRPAFAIFDNLTLARLASARPKSLGELAGTDGLGAERVRRYGRAILRALATAESEAPSDARKGAPPRNPSSRRKNAKERGDEPAARPRSRSGKAKRGA